MHIPSVYTPSPTGHTNKVLPVRPISPSAELRPPKDHDRPADLPTAKTPDQIAQELAVRIALLGSSTK